MADRCVDCGIELDPGASKVFTCCDECWDKKHPPKRSPARDGETLSDGARAEIQEFRHHLEGHAGTTFPGCRFCSARDAAEVRRHQAQRLSESEVAKVRESLEQGNSCKPRIALWLCDTIAALRAELAELHRVIDTDGSLAKLPIAEQAEAFRSIAIDGAHALAMSGVLSAENERLRAELADANEILRGCSACRNTLALKKSEAEAWAAIRAARAASGKDASHE